MAEPKPADKPNLVDVSKPADTPEAGIRGTPEAGTRATPEAGAKATPEAGAKATPEAGTGDKPDAAGSAKPEATASPPKPPAAAKPAPPASAPAQEKQGTRWGLWLLALLVAAAAVTAWVQTQRLDRAEAQVASLTGEVRGLESRLSAASAQLRTFEVQREQIRTVVDDLAAQLASLGALLAGEEAAGSDDDASEEPAL